MAKENQLLTTGEFASRAGIPASSVTRLIREKKIKAVKKSGKWLIHPSELKLKAVNRISKSRKSMPKKKTAKQKASAKAEKSPPPKTEKPAKAKTVAAKKPYTIAEFADMTYLTEYGVTQWLKQGRLFGHQNEDGQWLVDAANLEVANVKRLVRHDK